MDKKTVLVRVEALTEKDKALIEEASGLSKLPKASFYKAALLSYSKTVLNAKESDL